MKCTKCGREVPEGAVYCPFCTAGDSAGPGGDEGKIIRGGIKGGLIGLAVGLVPGLTALAMYGPERGIKAIAFAVPLGTFITGLIIGLVKAKQDWK